MEAYVDTSAILALLDKRDPRNADAHAIWDGLVGDAELYCSSYTLIDSVALVQNRMGVPAVRDPVASIYPLLSIVWVTQDVHDAGVGALLAAGRRQLSLVDCVSFEVMRRQGVQRVFAFDPHFAEKGFEPLTPAA